MIDIGFLTWTQQWEYWLFSRIFRPVEFGALFRWDFLFVPDQVWLLVGLYRTGRHLLSTPGSLLDRVGSLGSLMRADPITFVAFGLLFVAEPVFRGARRLVIHDEPVDPMDADLAIVAEEDNRLNERYANEIENSQVGNQTILPASVLNSCRNCRSDKVAATNMLSKCGHYPFCDECVRKEIFQCSLCISKKVPLVPDNVPVGMTGVDLAKPPTVVQLGNNVNVNRSCGVCQEREGLLTLMPCGHLLFCGPCVLSFKMRCPFCRSRIVRAVRGFDVRHAELAHK
jgi:hypothetical protein